MSNFKYKWVGANGFIDANVSGLKMMGKDVKCNGKPLQIRTPYIRGDVIEFDSEPVAKMLDTNGNWVRVGSSTASKPRKVQKKEDKEESE